MKTPPHARRAGDNRRSRRVQLRLSPLPRLIQDAPIEALDFVVFFAINLIFVGLAALALWPAAERMFYEWFFDLF